MIHLNKKADWGFFSCDRQTYNAVLNKKADWGFFSCDRQTYNAVCYFSFPNLLPYLTKKLFNFQ
jgi:hypothetical protein